MGKKVGKSVAIGTMIALSPFLAPQAVLASVTGTVGQSLTFSVTPPAFPTGSTDSYEYHVSVSDSNGNAIPDLQSTNPSMTVGSSVYSLPVTNQVYSSVYIPGLQGGSPSITLTPWDVGNFNVSMQLWDDTTGQAVGTAEYTPFTVQDAKPTLNYYGAYQTVNQTWYSTVTVGSLTTDPVYYHVQITDQSGNAIQTGDVSIGWGQAASSLQTVSSTDGIATIGKSTGLSPSDTLYLSTDFSTPGTYVMHVQVIDYNTGQLLGTAEGTTVAAEPNVSIAVYDSNGNPMNNTEVNITPEGSYNWTRPSGSSPISLYLPPNQKYDVTQVYDSQTGTWVILPQPVSFNVDPTTGAQVTINEPTFSTVSGTVTDGKNPIANGNLLIFPENSAGTPDFTNLIGLANTNSDGTFSVGLAPGKYDFEDINTQGGQDYGLQTSVQLQAGTNVSLNLQPLSIYLSTPWTPITNTDQYVPMFMNQAWQTTDVYFKVQLKNSDGSPDGAQLFFQAGAGGAFTPITLDSTGSATVYQGNPISLSAADWHQFKMNFANAGTYSMTVTVMSASTNAQLATVTEPLVVQAGNLDGTLYAADGKTPVPYEEVDLVNSTGATVPIWTNDTGQFVGNLTAGTWTISQLNVDSGNPITLTTPVTFTVPSTGEATPTVDDPTLNVVGTAYEDAAKMTPLADGYVQMTTSGGTIYDTYTDAQGRFAIDLPAGTYTITQEGDWNVWNTLSQPLTVGTGVTTVTVAPPAADFTMPVQDENGQAVTSGWIGVLDQTDYSAGNYANAQWFQVDSTGHVSGYLQPGSYVAFSISGNTSSYPVDVPFQIDSNDQLVGSVTIAPPQALVHGTVTDSKGNILTWADVVVAPVGDTNPADAVTLTTDANGNFNSLGWNSSDTYTNLLKAGTQYVVQGVSSNLGWMPLNETMPTVAAGSDWNIVVPVDDVTGTVSVNGTAIQSGWIAFTSANTSDGNWNWVPITSGTYSANLPAGEYTVAGIESDDNGQYSFYDGRVRAQTPVDVTNPLVPLTDNVVWTDNFAGTVTNGSTGVANATLVMSQSPSSWSNVQYVYTDSTGHFSTYLTPGTWYVVGVWSSAGWTELEQQETVSDTSTNVTISMAPNVSGTVSGVTGLSSLKDAWIQFGQLDANGNVQDEFWAPVDPATGTYSATLPDGNYTLLGLGELSSTGDYSWLDLSQPAIDFTASLTPITENVAAVPYTGTVSGLTADGYALFSNGGGKIISVPVKNGTLTTTLGNGWNLVAVETPDNYYSVKNNTASGVFNNGVWTITVS